MRRSTGISLTLILFTLVISCTQSERTNAQIETKGLPIARDLQRALDLSVRIADGTGISAAVAIPGEEIWTGVSGTSEPSKPITGDMLFDIASVGKNFVAVLICQLEEEGRLTLDDPLSKWLPDYPNIDKTVTIRQLLSHTSGIFDWVEHPQSPYWQPFNDILFDEVSSPEEVVNTLVSEPYFPPGAGFRYSTTNYTLLRMIAEKETGSKVADEIRRRFLEPLNLHHTVVLDAESSLPDHVSVAHAWWDVDGDGTMEDVTSRPLTWIASRSPALMYATAGDLARWSQALHGGKLLEPRSIEEILAFHRPTPTAPGEPLATGYGFGTQELRLGGLVMWGHLGWQYGYTSSMLYLPKYEASIVVLINDNNMMLINLATIALWLVTEYHLDTIQFLAILTSSSLLLSMFVLWPFGYLVQFIRNLRTGLPVGTDANRRTASVARWAAILCGVTIGTAVALYFLYSMNPQAPLTWAQGSSIARWYISLSIANIVLTIGLIYSTARVWKDNLWTPFWRGHYSLVTMAGLFLAYSLVRVIY